MDWIAELRLRLLKNTREVLKKRRKRVGIASEEPVPNSKMNGTDPAIFCSQEKFSIGMDVAHGLRRFTR